jgi:hypothetical protein
MAGVAPARRGVGHVPTAVGGQRQQAHGSIGMAPPAADLLDHGHLFVRRSRR